MSALIVIGAATAIALFTGILARKGRTMNLEEWAVGGRSFGSIFVFILLAGEIYTTFTFIGGSGWAYGKGAPVYYVLVYPTLGYVLSYWLMPPIWRYAKQHQLVSQSHFFSHKYDSPLLGVLAALVGVLAMVPFLMLQLKGLGIIVAAASYGAVSPTLAIWIGAAVVALYVIISGVRGSTWNAVFKDFLILFIVVFLGIYLPVHYHGSIGGMFRAIDAAKPNFLVFPETGMNIAWFQSTVLLTVLGFHMWPNTFGAAFTAKDDSVFRRNAVALPLYQLILLFALFSGFAVILVIPGLTGSEIDLALLKLSLQTFDPWFVGVIGAAGVLTALVPGSMLMLSVATVLANDVFRGAISKQVSDGAVINLARLFVPLIAIIAVLLAISGGDTIVALLLMGYSFVVQLFPSLISSLLPNNRITKQGAIAGIVAGLSVVVFTSVTKTSMADLLPFLPPSMQGVNIGFFALTTNVLTMLLVSGVTQSLRSSADPGGSTNRQAA